jgi:hypothetical protein
MSKRRLVLTWGLILMAATLNIAVVVLLLIRGDAGQSTVLLDVLFEAVPASFCVVGGLIALRRPENSVGWLCLTIGLLWSIEVLGYTIAGLAGDRGRIEAASWVGLLGSLWLPALGLTATHLALRVPTGELLSPRWRWYSRLCTAMLVLLGLLVATTPGRVADVPGTQNPIGSEALQLISPLFVAFALIVLGAFGSLVLRYRRARGVERLQIRWIALGGVVLLATVLTALLPTELGLAAENSAPAVVEGLLYIGLTTIPTAIGIAILRYRLYDIDVVINRTLVYGALTATLAGTYLGSVLLLQLILSGVTANSGLAVAGSTLAVAALFRPARGHIQATVDRRFYRRKYDAVRTLEQFGARLRDEVDLDALGGELRGVVADTMQPAHVSLWLRAPEAAR